jgi:tetratricopeptide (TPR) repeat protein/predicted Ser/Thr protein kinase
MTPASEGDPSMAADRFRRVSEVFERVRALTGADRTRSLDELCADDGDLRREVEELLAHHDDPSSLLDHPAVRVPGSAADVRGVAAEASAPLPDRIGRYRIIRVLGEGGMGVVYLAEQENPKREVALKVIRADLASPALLRRFEHEAQILARLQHPAIAPIYEAGTASIEGGSPRPFFAMEFVRGTPLTAFARERGLGTRDRLTLMASIADAVQHAHQKGVIHRDLKPGNILVTESGQPKILDFGVARVTDSDLQVTTIQTDVGQLIGTLPYMSPEQVAADPNALDTRSDVYALGVILYELLAGRLPYDLSRKMMIEAARVIRDEEPTRLSAVSRVFRGDIETIVGKALEKDRSRRYQSMSDFASDIRRFLRDEPIVARPPSATYQLRKFAKRNKLLVGSAAAVFLALVAGVIGTTIGMLRAEERRIDAEDATRRADLARAEADRQAGVARAVNEFFTDNLLAQADPMNQGNREISLREALDRAAAEIDGAFPDDPLIEAEIRNAVGQAYRGLGLLEQADTHLRRARELYGVALGEEHETTLVARVQMAFLHNLRGHLADAEREYLETLAIQKRVLGETHPHTLTSLNNIAGLYWNQGRFNDVEPMWLAVLEARRADPANEPWRVATTLNNLGSLYNYLARYDEAERYLLEALEIRRRDRGPEHPDTLQSMHNLAWLYGKTGRLAEAIAMNRESLAIRSRTLGPEHHDTLFTMANLAGDLAEAGQLDEAEAMQSTALDARRRTLGPHHAHTLQSMMNLAIIHQRRDRLDQSETLLREIISLCREHMQPDYFLTGQALQALGEVLAKAGGRDAEAEQCLLEGHDILERAFDSKNPRTISAIDSLIRFYEATNRPEMAAEWRERKGHPSGRP